MKAEHGQAISMTRRITPEDSLQITVKDMLDQFALPRVVYLHVPNEGKRSRIGGDFMKRKGMRPGASDWLLAIPPNARLHALELKAPGNEPTDLQEKFGEDVIAAGGKYDWADTTEKAARILLDWGAIKDPKL